MLITPIKISPFARRSSGGGLTLQQIIDLFGFSHAWSSENLTIAGTTTTANDYKGVHNLANPGATNQPLYNLSSINFGGKPSLTFSGVDDYLIKNTANFNNEASGFQVDVFKGTTPRVLTSADNGTNSRYIRGYTNAGKIGFELVIVTNRFTANTLVWNTAVGNVVAYGSNGSAYLISLNGASNSGANLNILNGADNGAWFSGVGLRDNVAIGGTISSTPNYANIEWVFSGVGTNTSEADLNLLTLLLKEYYNLP
jgi:hypothetical protein